MILKKIKPELHNPQTKSTEMKKHIPQNYFMVSKFTKTIFRAIETPQMHMSNFQIKIANYKTRMNLHSQQHMNTSSKTQIKSD